MNCYDNSTSQSITYTFKGISHCIFRNLKAFLYGEEHRMYLCNISVFVVVSLKAMDTAFINAQNIMISYM